MITTVAELLEDLVAAQVMRLDEFKLAHAPTIGAMYEGLSQDVLNQAFPLGSNLRVATGFVYSGSGDNLSPQIDCMLVIGSGEQIPFTAAHKWHVKDVVAVIEVKKNLYSKELAESLDHSSRVREVSREWARTSDAAESYSVDTSLAMKTFRQMTGVHFKEIAELSKPQQVLFHALVMEVVAPVRVILGYHGFKNVNNLRASCVAALRARTGIPGFGFSSLPQLVISGRHSLVKANGLPYVGRPPVNGAWPIVFSTSASPILLLLEIIWSKIEAIFGVVSPNLWGQDLTMEALNPLLSATVEETSESVGWTYGIYATDRGAALDRVSTTWEPAVLTEEAFLVVNQLCANVSVSTLDPELVGFLKSRRVEMTGLVHELLATGLVSMRSDEFELSTDACLCAILPDGRYIAGENNTGRLERWIAAYAD